jgi:excinuclease ABC subunit A
LYILDEPTTGLHFADVKQLMDVIQRLVDQGNTVIMIEHNLDVLLQADHIIDLGPEGGDKGGWVIATGTPEQVAKCGDSYTGLFISQMLNRSTRKNRRQ